MVQLFNPELNKVYFINQYTLLHILSGSGGIQVDFKNYFDWEDKVIYLEKGQYIKFLSDDFHVQKMEFHSKTVFENREVRVLFKHLISLGYIDALEGSPLEKYLSGKASQTNSMEIIDHSLKQWFHQNPFNASKSEYESIFDVKESIDQLFSTHLTSLELHDLANGNGMDASRLIKEKLGVTARSMLEEKRMVEGKKKVVFTDCSVQEVCFDVGFKDPAYFNRVFKKRTGYTPIEFRNNFAYEHQDTFVENLIELIRTHHRKEHQMEFYADKLNISVKALAKKTRDKTQETLGSLIRNELIGTSKKMLQQELTIKDISIQLGFEEPNHFSAFFKNNTGETPSQYKNKKVQGIAPFL
ncbi:helix-turn-helix domain-containing protein [Allomuricauda sp. M10]|uniref:helix-turn-helix domain-containing protein n=1 Tax=Allomuricauda sp. M10 TaxID=2683292 RepID=UPI001D18C329|nr:helix-turn-helix domain-containing protein [Muricauda sp. M10]